MRSDDLPPARPGVGAGLGAFFGGVSYVATTSSTWKYACVPLSMALLLGCGLGSLGLKAAQELSSRLVTQAGVGQNLLTITLGLMALVLAALLALALAQPLSGWALEAISRQQQQQLTGSCPPEASFLHSLWVGLRCALFVLVVGGTSSVVMFLATLVFPPAAVVTGPLSYLLVAWLLAWDLVDYPLGLRGLGIRSRLRWVGSHFGAFTAFGLAWATVLLVPGIFLLVLPMGVAGATRLVVAAETTEALPA